MKVRIFLLFSYLCSLIAAQTIRDIIKTQPNLARLNTYISKLRIYEVLSKEDKAFTFFAPNDTAFNNVPSSEILDLVSNSVAAQQRSNDKFMYHIIPERLTRDQLAQDAIRSTDAPNGAPVYLRTVNGKTFINGAELGTEIVASNGIVHIIDSYLYDTGSADNVLAYLSDASNRATSPTIKKFFEFVTQYKNEDLDKWRDLNGQRYVTMFVPTDDYMNTLTQQIRTLITTNKAILKRVVESHIISGNAKPDVTSVYHSRLLRDQALQAYDYSNSSLLGITAADGLIRPKIFGKNLYISNNCAQGQIVRGNITVGNGVIHLIDGILGYLPHDIYKYLDVNQNTVGRFYALVGMANMQNVLQVTNQGVADVPAADKYTVFVPIDTAFTYLDSATSLTQNRTLLDKVIKMHMIQGELSMLDVSNTTTRDTIAEVNPRIKAKFYRNGQDIIVEVDYVRAKVVRADTCVKNGIIHYVDHILGVPYVTVFREMEINDLTIDMVNLVRQVGLDQQLRATNMRYTIFIPVTEAFRHMRLTDNGRKFLDSQEVYRLESFLRRHILKGEIFLDQIPVGSTRNVQTEAPGVEIGLEHSYDDKYYVLYGTKRINVIDRDNRKLNGVINFIDDAIYTEDPRDLQVVGSAVRSTTNHMFILFLVLIYMYSSIL